MPALGASRPRGVVERDPTLPSLVQRMLVQGWIAGEWGRTADIWSVIRSRDPRRPGTLARAIKSYDRVSQAIVAILNLLHGSVTVIGILGVAEIAPCAGSAHAGRRAGNGVPSAIASRIARAAGHATPVAEARDGLALPATC